MRRLAEDPITLADLAAEFDISRERVRQINVSSFVKVQGGEEPRRHDRNPAPPGN